MPSLLHKTYLITMHGLPEQRQYVVEFHNVWQRNNIEQHIITLFS